MAMKPFDIQEATLKMGGVALEAGNTGVVIPGVTQATNYRVEEVEDTGDQTHTFSPDSEMTVIDAELYSAIVNQNSESGYADYTATTDGEGYIDEIQVNGGGSYNPMSASVNGSTDMYAYIGAGSASDRPLIPEDWVQIPFRPKMRAGEVETIGGGSGTPTNRIDNGMSTVIIPTEDGPALINVNDDKEWQFLVDGSLMFPDGSVQTTAYTTTDSAPLGYFVTMNATNNNGGDWDGEAVVVDGDGNTYVSYSYYDDNAGNMVGGIAKFDSTGTKLWAKNFRGNGNYQYPRISSLEYFGLAPFITVIGYHYNNDTSLDEGFMFMIDTDGGFAGDYDVNFTTGAGMMIEDGVFYDENGPAAVVVGQTYNENATFTLTPIEPSGIDKLYVTWSDLTASGLTQGQTARYVNNGNTYYSNNNVLEYQVVATVNGQGTQEYPYMYVNVTYNEAGVYNITNINGGSGYADYSNQTLKVLGSNLGGVDNTTLATANLGYASASGETSLYFVVNDYPNLLTDTGGDGAWISGPGIPGGRARVYNSQQAGGFFRFDIAPVVTLNSGDTYTFSRGNDITFDFDFATFNNAGQPYNNPVGSGISNIQGDSISNVHMTFSGGFDFSTVIGTPQTDMFVVSLNGQAAVVKIGGNSNWAINVGGSNYEELHSVAVDPANGDVYAAGRYYDNATSKSGAVFKFDIAGNLAWAKYMDSTDNLGMELRTIDLTTYGEGQTAAFVMGDDRSVTKIDGLTGDILWQVYTPDVSLNTDPRGCVTPEGDYIALLNDDNNYHLFVTRLSGVDGSVVWQKDISYHQGFNWNGELYMLDDFDATNIDCDATTISITGSSYYYDGNNGVYRGYVINIQSDGAGNGTYGEYTINDSSIEWFTRSTTSASFAPEFHTSSVQSNPLTLSSDNDNSSATVTSLGGTAPTVAGIERHSASAGDDNVTLATEHNGKFLYYNGSNGNSWIYVPSNNDVALPIGFIVTIVIANFNGNRVYVNNNTGSQNAIIDAVGYNPGNTNYWYLNNNGQCGVYTLMKVDTDNWMLAGPDIQVD